MEVEILDEAVIEWEQGVFRFDDLDAQETDQGDRSVLVEVDHPGYERARAGAAGPRTGVAQGAVAIRVTARARAARKVSGRGLGQGLEESRGTIGAG